MSEMHGSISIETPGSVSIEMGGSAYTEMGGSIWGEIVTLTLAPPSLADVDAFGARSPKSSFSFVINTMEKELQRQHEEEKGSGIRYR